MCFFSSGPARTICFSSSVSSRQGTSVRTPNSRAICGCTLNPNICHGTTVPSSMLRPGSRISVASSTSRTVPVPSQVRHAPAELNARSSAPGAKNSAPHSGQRIDSSAATFRVGAFGWSFGHSCTASRENIRRTTFNISVAVPKVERTPGTPGRCRSASAAGTCRTRSTSARGAWAIRRRV